MFTGKLPAGARAFKCQIHQIDLSLIRFGTTALACSPNREVAKPLAYPFVGNGKVLACFSGSIIGCQRQYLFFGNVQGWLLKGICRFTGINLTKIRRIREQEYTLKNKCLWFRINSARRTTHIESKWFPLTIRLPFIYYVVIRWFQWLIIQWAYYILMPGE